MRSKVDVGAAARLVFSLVLAWVIPGGSAASFYSLLPYNDYVSFCPANIIDRHPTFAFHPNGDAHAFS